MKVNDALRNGGTTGQLRSILQGNRVRWILPGLMVLGLLVRAWGIGFGLPYLYHPDEPLAVDAVIHMVRNGDLNPHAFGYGSLFYDLNALAYAAYYLAGQLLGIFRTPLDLPHLQYLAMGVGRAILPTEMLVGRGVSLLAGVLCIPLVYVLGKRLSGRGVGLLAAALVALSPTLVLHSQYVTPNALVTLMSLAALLTLVRLTPQARWQDFALAGIGLGAAIASKYNAVFLAPAYLVVYLMLFGRSLLRRRGVYLTLLAAILTFFVITPFALFDNAKFMDDTIYHVTGYEVLRHAGLEGGSLQFYLSILLNREGLLILAALGAAVVYAIRRNRIGLMLSAFTLPYFFYISQLWLRTDYTLMLILPELFVMAADAIMMVWHYFRRTPFRLLSRVARAGLVILVIISIGCLIYQTVNLNVKQTTPDGREFSRQWIAANVAPGTQIAAEAYSAFIDPQRYNVTYFISLRLNSPDWYLTHNYDLLAFSSSSYQRYYLQPELYPAEIAQYDALFARFPAVAVFDQTGTTVRILKVKP
jgi:uncharacterized membrane protein